MYVFEVIKNRRSIREFKDEMIPLNYIDKLLEAATWAPNHYQTEPWRFFVICGEARKRFGAFLRKIALQTNMNLDLDRIERSPMRAPVIIAVAVQPSNNKKVKQIEQIAAVSCAIQNMMLVAHEYGLGTIWRTGELIYQKGINEFFQISQDYIFLGFIYVGYPVKSDKNHVNRTHFSQKTTWLNE